MGLDAHVSFLRSQFAPAPRTLVDIVLASAAAHPDAPALDNGSQVLTYTEFLERAEAVAEELAGLGVGPGERVGIRVRSGTVELYTAIVGTLLHGCAYVPVDADDPDERARIVFSEADVSAIVGAAGDIVLRGQPRAAVEVGDPADRATPALSDDAWIIFTSGSTGKPKGVAVTHRSAAAFVDAESRMFLQAEPLGPGDRVMAGLSVAFDASCEEMWLAWAYGACLVPAPRALVRSGVEVAPWLTANRISVVSTVPTLVSLWPDSALTQVRLVILGGEACPPELAARLARPGREVWNTYGPTEATVVACGALLDGVGPVRIGLPLDGWDLVVVDDNGVEVPEGGTGELIIGGVGLARYLDPHKDAEKYAPMPTLGWERAYRSGDRVINDPAGLIFTGRADDQIKLGGRRIELGEIDNVLLRLPGVNAAAAAVRRTAAGNQILVGYLAVDDSFDAAAATATLRREQPAALVPRLAVVEDLPLRTSGKVDRDALVWPLPSAAPPAGELNAGEERVASVWQQVLGAAPANATTDFFDDGGGSLSAAQLVTLLRAEHPDLTVADLYDRPTVRALAKYLETLDSGGDFLIDREVPPTPRKTQLGQVVTMTLARALAAPTWLTWSMLAANLAGLFDGLGWLPQTSWWVLVPLIVVFLTPPGRMLLAAAVARTLLRGLQPGTYPRGGKVHLRIRAAEQATEQLGAHQLSGAALVPWFGRLLGSTIGPDVDLQSLPPVTGMLRLGSGAVIEPEVDLAGHWIDGDVVHVGLLEVGAGAKVGTRSMLTPGSKVGEGSEIAPGSAVFGVVPDGQFWSGAPAARAAKRARGPWEQERPPAGRGWWSGYLVAGVLLGLIPALATAVSGVAVLALADLSGTHDVWSLLGAVAWWLPVGLAIWLVVVALVVWAVVRGCGVGLTPGVHPVRSRVGLQAWATMRVLDSARDWLYGLYASTLTPVWLRSLGARIGADVEASTVLMIPSLTSVGAQSFLADDTLIGGYELGGGWLRLERVKVGKRSFVGNSGMAAPGRKVPKKSLVAVLSAAPARGKAKAGQSWVGSPPAQLRRTAGSEDSGRTYAPPTRLKVARGCFEVLRLLAPLVQVLLFAGVLGAALLVWSAGREVSWPLGIVAVLLTIAAALTIAGALAAAVAVLAKWAMVGRVKPGTHPLWSSFVWRNEVADAFVEWLAAGWFSHLAAGTPLLSVWLRAMGARVGRGVWCESYWLPEPDLIRLDDGACVNRGTVVQTHLFHDRVLALDPVRLRRGATLGPNAVILPAASIGRHATVGPVSLVMRGESVPDRSRWIGNPIGPWTDQAVDPLREGMTS